jgi:hypothetical protein
MDDVVARFAKRFFGEIIHRQNPDVVPAGYLPTTRQGTELGLNGKIRDAAWREIDKDPFFWEDLEAYEDNVEALHHWIHFSLSDVYFVTARAATGKRSALAQTGLWLRDKNLALPNTSVVTVTKAKDKWRVYGAIGIQYSLDDFDENVLSCAQATKMGALENHRAYLLDQPWNQHATDLDYCRVKSMAEFLDIIDKEQK